MRDSLWVPGKRYMAQRAINETGVETVSFCPLGLLMDTCEKLGLINPGYWVADVKFWSPDDVTGGECGVLTRQAARAAGLVGSTTGRALVNPAYAMPEWMADKYELLPGKRYAIGWLHDRAGVRPEHLAYLVAGLA
jgi:hypothetical protein